MSLLNITIDKKPIIPEFKGTDAVITVGSKGKLLIQEFISSPARVHPIGNEDALSSAIIPPEKKNISVLPVGRGVDLYPQGEVSFTTTEGSLLTVTVTRK